MSSLTHWGFGFDFGVQYQTKNGWYFGIMGRDITTTFNTWSFDENRINDIQNAIIGENQTLPSKKRNYHTKNTTRSFKRLLFW